MLQTLLKVLLFYRTKIIFVNFLESQTLLHKEILSVPPYFLESEFCRALCFVVYAIYFSILSSLNENLWNSIKNISLSFVPGCPINNIPALVQIMFQHWRGDKPLSESMMVILTRKHASLSLNELRVFCCISLTFSYWYKWNTLHPEIPLIQIH